MKELELVRKQKHEVEEARVVGARNRDAKVVHEVSYSFYQMLNINFQIEQLVKENTHLQEELRLANDKLDKKEDEIKGLRDKMSRLEHDYFNEQSEVNKVLILFYYLVDFIKMQIIA